MRSCWICFLILGSTSFGTLDYSHLENAFDRLRTSGGIEHWGENSPTPPLVLIFFHDRSQKKSVFSWFERYADQWVLYPNAMHLHILFPGGISFMTPRKAIVKKVQMEIRRERKKLQTLLPSELAKKMSQISTLWYLDRRRKISRDLLHETGSFRGVILDRLQKKVYDFANLLQIDQGFFELLQTIKTKKQTTDLPSASTPILLRITPAQ